MSDPNLDRHMSAVNEAVLSAQAKGDHAHAGVSVGIGEIQTGPILSWEYTPDVEGYGWIEIRNYRGETVHKPLTAVCLPDVRPCWDPDYDRS